MSWQETCTQSDSCTTDPDIWDNKNKKVGLCKAVLLCSARLHTCAGLGWPSDPTRPQQIRETASSRRELSAVKLIRTVTTLDLSQKAEKVCYGWGDGGRVKRQPQSSLCCLLWTIKPQRWISSSHHCTGYLISVPHCTGYLISTGKELIVSCWNSLAGARWISFHTNKVQKL